MLHDVRISYIPLLKSYISIDDRNIHKHQCLFELLKEYFDEIGFTIVSIGDKYLSGEPTNSSIEFLNSEKFESDLHFPLDNQVRAKLAFHDLEKKYVWQHIPFYYSGAELKGGFFPTDLLIKINHLLRHDSSLCFSYGNISDTPIVLEYQNYLVNIVRSIINFYEEERPENSYIIPFHPLEHFLRPSCDIDEALLIYQEWNAAFQATTTVLRASSVNFKAILGLPKWIYDVPETKELMQYQQSEKLGPLYKSPHHKMVYGDPNDCDNVGVDTINAFEIGDFLTIVRWNKGSNTIGQEWYYHVDNYCSPIDELQNKFENDHLIVYRKTIDIEDAIGILSSSKSIKMLN